MKFGNFRMTHKTQENTFLKEVNEQRDKESHVVRSRRVQSAGASVPVEMGSATIPAHGCVRLFKALQTPVFRGVFWRFHNIGVVDY